MKITGSDTDFYAIWDEHKQTYTVYKNEKFIITSYKFDEVKNYLGKGPYNYDHGE